MLCLAEYDYGDIMDRFADKLFDFIDSLQDWLGHWLQKLHEDKNKQISLELDDFFNIKHLKNIIEEYSLQQEYEIIQVTVTIKLFYD